MKPRHIAMGLPALLFALAGSVAADDRVEELQTHLGKAVGAFEASELYREQCDRRDPSGASARLDALSAWRYDNEYADYQRVLAGMTRQIPELAGQLAPQRKALAAKIEQDLASKPAQCKDLRAVLDNEQFEVKSSVRRLVSLSRNLSIKLPDRPQAADVAPKTVEETEILPLATLSARIEAVMAEVGSREGARERTSLRRARADHAEVWLKQDGMQVLFGRVTDDDELREWRDDLQSTFKVTCRSFHDKRHEERMASVVGQNMVVVGSPSTVNDGTEGGIVRLDRCSVFTAQETGRPTVKEQDRAGLMLRPLEFDEAFAGPDEGIALRQVDRVLYDASFENRLDGYGNGYVDRKEDIYVLLRDGTAYLHTWNFPFTDLNVELSRKREPGRWFGWKQRGDRTILTVKGGWREGKEVVLEQPQRLRPVAFDSIDAEYYYLQVGMGGRRQDGRYEFSKDGTLEYGRSGFVAGNVATSYIIVAGGDSSTAKGRYRIKDYALIVEVDGQTERRFLAVPESAKRARPDTLLIGGSAHWLDDE